MGDVRRVAGPPPLIASKLRAPGLPEFTIDRPQLLRRFAQGHRLVLVTGPPGYGKTTAVRRWIDVADEPVAWLSLDLLDNRPATFWTHFVGAVAAVLPDVADHASAALVDTPGTEFVNTLIALIERSSYRGTIVLDDLGCIEHAEPLAGLELIVERVGHRLRLVVTARADPTLPLARWRSAGWVRDIDETSLSFADEEAIAVAATVATASMTHDDVIALNRRVEGWPIGLYLGLIATTDSFDGDAGSSITGLDRFLADYLAGEVIDRLPAHSRTIIFDLSVVDWLDADICRRLAGQRAAEIVTTMHRQRMFVSAVPGRAGVLRFHRPFREAVEAEFRWHDPVRHADMHRKAAELWKERGRLNAAYRHLVAAGDVDAANDLVLQPTIRSGDRGDRTSLITMMERLPRMSEVDDAALAFDIALAWLFAGSGQLASVWCDRASSLMDATADGLRPRLLATRCVLAMLKGDLETATRELSAFEALEGSAGLTGPVERVFITGATRVALATGQLDQARLWLGRARAIAGGDAFDAIVGMLHAWADLLVGKARPALQRAEESCAVFESAGSRPHNGASEAMVVSAWAHLATGDLHRANELAEMARFDAELLGFDWNRVRASAVIVSVRFLLDGPAAGLAAAREARLGPDQPVSPALMAPIDAIEARALIRMGRTDAARTLLATADDSPTFALVRAALAIADDQPEQLDELFVTAADWRLPDRLTAATLAAAVAPANSAADLLADAVEEGATFGWVSPFLGHGTSVDEVLRQLPLRRLNPALERHLLSGPVKASASHLFEALTSREQTILDLLPTHLSYGEIANRLHLSINTVKSNIKSIYRKLAVTTRSDAVEAGRGLGLI